MHRRDCRVDADPEVPQGRIGETFRQLFNPVFIRRAVMVPEQKSVGAGADVFYTRTPRMMYQLFQFTQKEKRFAPGERYHVDVFLGRFVDNPFSPPRHSSSGRPPLLRSRLIKWSGETVRQSACRIEGNVRCTCS